MNETIKKLAEETPVKPMDDGDMMLAIGCDDCPFIACAVYGNPIEAFLEYDRSLCDMGNGEAELGTWMCLYEGRDGEWQVIGTTMLCYDADWPDDATTTEGVDDDGNYTTTHMWVDDERKAHAVECVGGNVFEHMFTARMAALAVLCGA